MSYMVKLFKATKIQIIVKVELTWDEEDSSRQEKLKQGELYLAWGSFILTHFRTANVGTHSI